MDTFNTSTPVGFVGLGNMGAAMVRHLLQAGNTVTAWARNQASFQAFDKLPLRK
ncbi:MAG TPA: NAD(P)-binding domain-containing protein, partial [Limnobacter sp.]|nr:NAD(P)-binding domain-containing protein [Limnobacter sp.]